MGVKFENLDVAKATLSSTKEELQVAKGELKAFEKENKLAVGEDHSTNEKFGKRWSKLNAVVVKKRQAIEGIKSWIGDNKPAKADRVSKYVYPEGVVSAGDKKKYRTKMRNEKKKAEKGESEEGGKKKNKDKSEKVEEQSTETKKDKKKKKKTEAGNTED